MQKQERAKTIKALAEKEARSLCSADLVKRWQVIQPYRVVVATSVLWLQLVGAWLVALWGSPLLWIPAFVVICACISAMQLWVHESSHFILFHSRKLNDIWATLFFASPIGVSVKTYRRFHMTHHARLATTTDMDRFAFNVDVRGPRKLLGLFLRGLSCLDAYRLVARKYIGSKAIASEEGRDWSLFVTAGWNILLLVACILAGRWYLYFALWAYPILGVAVTTNLIRSIAEHQPIGFAGPVSADQDISPISRTTLPGSLEKWLMFQANFNYHFEHHLYPTVPAVNLPTLHRHLLEKGFYQKHPELLQRSAIAKVFDLSREKCVF